MLQRGGKRARARKDHCGYHMGFVRAVVAVVASVAPGFWLVMCITA